MTTHTITNATTLFQRGSPLHGFVDELTRPDYESDRARALYTALGADPGDEEYVLGALPDGRWALLGMPVEGHRFAVEAEIPDEPSCAHGIVGPDPNDPDAVAKFLHDLYEDRYK